MLPMTGFELRTSGIGSDCSTNWAITTAPNNGIVYLKAARNTSNVVFFISRVKKDFHGLINSLFLFQIEKEWYDVKRFDRLELLGSVTRFVDLLDFGKLFKAFGNN